ncbi:MAG: hypothetical protein E7243_17940 [Lacrimispora celerecrescens]|uniref:hypothetical protein n=1 Tax=Lacrimispora indolis TaxID=69825 RepID=UPI00040FE23F|nr:hypothetical protein [[Clostridium] methoxybenzovorans]MBE7721374.1 hypothetical protein [Lacrimispora celerecrescens]
MKKLITLLFVLTMSVSIAACGNKETSSATEQSSQTEETSEAPAESEVESEVEAAAVVFPDLDGFTREVQSTMGIDVTMYQAEDNSAIIVMGMPGDEETYQLFATRDAEAEALLNEAACTQLEQQLSQIVPDFKAQGKFETVEGKEAYVITANIPKEQAGAAGADIDIHYYMIATKDSIYIVIGTSLGADIVEGIKSTISLIP